MAQPRSKDALVARLRQEADAAGFAACGIARGEVAPHAESLEAWIREGNHADMDWMERSLERRKNPQRVLPGCRSVIVLAANYWQGAAPRGGARPGEAVRGRIARYAWGDDYHDVLRARMDSLDVLLAEAGGEQKCYVDTGHVLEREFSALAGLGWHGKSSMLIDIRRGAWTFLACILTTLELPPDAPAAPHCGRCTRCIDACPTRAIVAPQQVDARRCIAYLTIENKGPIPMEFREAIGDRIFGCDDCIEACPWNRFAQASTEAAFLARPAVASHDLRDFLAMDGPAFAAAFRGSPIKRIKRRGFLRNVCVALGNIGNREDLPALQVAAADPEPLIAEHAAWAINRIAARQSRPN